MLDASKRQELSEKLRNKVKKASSNVSTKVEAEKGDFKVVMSPTSIDQFYKNTKIASIKIAELSEEDIQSLNQDPHTSAYEILDTFVDNFDAQEFEKTASTKTAANDTLSEKTWDMVTQKQLDDQKPKLHPRKDEYYKNVTQKQLPEHGQRPGTYDVVTEAQFRDERKTFYGADRTSGDWHQEDRNIVTEGQLDKGASEFTEIAASDRGEMGAKFDGDVEKQHKMTGEKQIMELLKHHKWTEPLTTTEGKDQLGKQDGELARIQASDAQNIIKESLNAMGKTVLAAAITPADLADLVKRLVSDKSKYTPLANALSNYSSSDISSIEKKVAKAKTFGKTANAGSDWSEMIAADVLARQLSKINYPAKHVVSGLVSLSTRSDFVNKIATAVDEVLSSENTSTDESLDVFAEVLDGKAKTANTNDNEIVHGKDDSDGLYSYVGTISDISESVTNQDKFASAAAEYAKNAIISKLKLASSINLQAQTLDVNEDKNAFEVIFKDVNKNTESLEVRAERRRNLAKESQLGGAGGAPPAAGGGGSDMGNSAPPPAAGDMGAPPAGEALSQEPAPAMGEEAEGTSGEPQPPGTICPACGKQDVDIDNGEFRCNNCGSEGTLHVSLEIKKWTGTINESEKEDKEGFDLNIEPGMGAQESAMSSTPGGEAGTGTTLPSVPVAASFKVTGRMLEKLASQDIRCGQVCPSCGSKNTDISKSASSKGDDGICWNCLQEFNVQFKTTPGKKNNVIAQYVWKPKIAEQDCAGCNRLKTAFVNSLENYGMKWHEFDKLSQLDKSNLILKLAKSGWLDLSNALESTNLPVEKIASSSRWKGYEKFDKFPSSSCVEKIARRFGENATSMSGPCQGKNLAQCVCSQLEGLGIYTDGIAAKVASVQGNANPFVNSPMESCIELNIKKHNFKPADACIICDGLRAAYATADELMIEAIAQAMPMTQQPKPMSNSMPNQMPSPKPMSNHLSPDPAAKPMNGPMSDLGTGAGNAMSGMGQGIGNAARGVGGGMGEMMSGMGQGINNAIKPMDGGMNMPKPMDEPISPSMEGPGDSSFNLEIGADPMGDVDLGFGDDMVTIQIPHDAMHALQTLMQALQGQVGNDMIDTTGDILNMGDADADDSLEEDEANESSMDQDNESSDIPGLSDDSDDELIKESPDESKSNKPEFSSDKSEPKEDKPEFNKHEESNSDDSEESNDSNNSKEETSDDTESKENIFASDQKITKQAGLDQMLFSMKKGAIKTQKSAIDSLYEGLLQQVKIAAKDNEEIKKVKSSKGKDSKITISPSQDAKDIGKVKDGGKIGHEEPFSKGVKTKPDVPRGDSLIGDEGKELKINESGDLPTIPHGSGNLDGEEHFKSDGGNEVDGNQGGAKFASKKCKCGDSECGCNCNSNMCAKPCCASSKTKTASNNMKNPQTWSVQPNHQYYSAFMKKAESGQDKVKLTDGNFYNMFVDQNKNIILTPEKFAQNSSNIDTIKKESQQVSPKKIDSLMDDPDINQKSGPGAGKTHENKTHSLAVDEKKPSEGVSDPSVPEAPNGGKLAREHTVEKATDGPEIPAGGGMNPDYDQNKKNEPEKLEQMTGIQHDISLAKNDEAIKIAGQMLKANMITADELPEKVRELSAASDNTIADYKKLISQAYETKGMKRQAHGLEQPILTGTTNNQQPNDLQSSIQGLFKLEKQNQDYNRLVADSGNTRLWK